MTKFNEKSLSHFALAFFYAAMQAFDSRMAEVESALERLQTMRPVPRSSPTSPRWA